MTATVGTPGGAATRAFGHSHERRGREFSPPSSSPYDGPLSSKRGRPSNGKRERMKRMWAIVLVGCALLLWMGVPADAAPLTCDQVTGGTPTSLTVTTAAQAAQIAGNGINDDDCDLTVKTSILPTVLNFLLEAKTITVQGPSAVPNGPPAPISTNVQIVNPNAGTSVTLLAKDSITIDQGSIKATSKVHIECTAAVCPITVTKSELMATNSVTTAVGGGFNGSGGRLEVETKGNLSITTTSFTGGDKVIFSSAEDRKSVV